MASCKAALVDKQPIGFMLNTSHLANSQPGIPPETARAGQGWQSHVWSSWPGSMESIIRACWLYELISFRKELWSRQCPQQHMQGHLMNFNSNLMGLLVSLAWSKQACGGWVLCTSRVYTCCHKVKFRHLPQHTGHKARQLAIDECDIQCFYASCEAPCPALFR